MGIGGLVVLLKTPSAEFCDLLRHRYAGFLLPGGPADAEFKITLEQPVAWPAGSVDVNYEAARWVLTRGDFRAHYEPALGRGAISQRRSPYSTDSVLRIVHTLLLAARGGFLLHAASGIRDGRAFIFTGVSGAGKTTITRLAPPDVALLSDEISFIRPDPPAYRAYGTPFSGELAKPGENSSAPVAALDFLAKGPRNSIAEIGNSEAARRLMRNILFFAKDPDLVERLFDSACRFVETVPTYRLTFYPDERVWDLIR